MTVINVTLYSTICLMHRSEELSFPLWYEAAVLLTTICYIRFPSIKMPSGTVKTAAQYDTEFVYLSPSSILHFFLSPSSLLCLHLEEVRLRKKNKKQVGQNGKKRTKRFLFCAINQGMLHVWIETKGVVLLHCKENAKLK